MSASTPISELVSFTWPERLPDRLVDLAGISGSAVRRLVGDHPDLDRVLALHAEAVQAVRAYSGLAPTVDSLGTVAALLAAEAGASTASIASLRGRWLTYLLDRTTRQLIAQPQRDGSVRWAKRFTFRFPTAADLGDVGTAVALVIYGGPAKEVAHADDVVAAATSLTRAVAVQDVVFHDRFADSPASLATSLRSGTAANADAYAHLTWAPPIA